MVSEGDDCIAELLLIFLFIANSQKYHLNKGFLAHFNLFLFLSSVMLHKNGKLHRKRMKSNNSGSLTNYADSASYHAPVPPSCRRSVHLTVTSFSRSALQEGSQTSGGQGGQRGTVRAAVPDRDGIGVRSHPAV